MTKSNVKSDLNDVAEICNLIRFAAEDASDFVRDEFYVAAQEQLSEAKAHASGLLKLLEKVDADIAAHI